MIPFTPHLRRKRLALFAGASFTFLVCTAAFWYFRMSYVAYRIDEYNNCAWSNGEVTLTTAVNGPEHIEFVKRSSEKAFVDRVSHEGICAYKK